MKINEWQRLTSTNNGRPTTNKEKTISSAPSAPMKDEILLSTQAKELLESQRKAEQTRADHLETLRTAVENGTYQVDAQALAEKVWPHVERSDSSDKRGSV